MGLRDDFSNHIQTYMGGRFCPVDPSPEDILIEDIAHALSLQCRFGGHVKEFYSVAQHCVLVSEHCPLEDALWGLLHDASEAYISDVCRPTKKLLTGYAEIERRLMEAVCKRFHLPQKEPPSVKEADNLLLRAEAFSLMSPLRADLWEHWPSEPTSLRVFPWGSKRAEDAFLARFNELW